jgi:hypothetical protein
MVDFPHARAEIELSSITSIIGLFCYYCIAKAKGEGEREKQESVKQKKLREKGVSSESLSR